MKKLILVLTTICSAFSMTAQTAGLNTNLDANPFSKPAFFSKKRLATSGASELAFSKGDFTAILGYGFVDLSTSKSQLENAFKAVGTYNSTSTVAPVFLKLGYGISDSYEVGLNFHYDGSSGTGDILGLKYDASMIQVSALARVTGHFAVGANLDPYWTAAVGYMSGAVTSTYSVNASTGFTYELGIGARYLFLPNFGVYAELGLGRTLLQVGLVTDF